MSRGVARWSGLALVGALLASVALLVVLTTGTVLISQHGQLGGSLVRAEFRDVTPLVPGMSVRVNGIPAGTVQEVALTDRGTARVDLRLARDVPPVRADATAAIRQKDVLGDSYVELGLGRASRRLGDATIPVARTLTMPRLDEVFSTFRKPVRDGLQALAVELGTTLDRRGGDLNAALLHVRSGIASLDDLLGELDGQRAGLRQVVDDADRVTGALVAGRQGIDDGLPALRRLLTATAAHGDALGATLTRAPATLRTASGTLDRVATAARAARPLARDAAAAAPQLNAVATRVAPWAKDARATLAKAAPLAATLRRTLTVAEPVVADLQNVDPVDMLLPAAKLLSVLSPVFADGAPALFGATTYGKDPNNQTGLGAVAVERGDQPAAPTDPERTWVRTGVVLTCELFGQPIKPGCLLGVAGLGTGSAGAKGKAKRTPSAERPEGGDGPSETPAAPAAPVTSAAPAAPTTTTQTTTETTTTTVPLPSVPTPSTPAPPPTPDAGAVSTLLDYLLGGGSK